MAGRFGLGVLDFAFACKAGVIGLVALGAFAGFACGAVSWAFSDCSSTLLKSGTNSALDAACLGGSTGNGVFLTASILLTCSSTS